MVRLEQKSDGDRAFLSVDAVRKKFGRQQVLQNISLVIDKGQTFSLLGPSGVGKSTLVKILLGLVAPDGGRIFLAGRDITDIAAVDRNIGIVYQNYSLFENMTVRENVVFPLRARRARNPLSMLLSGIGLSSDRELLRAADESLSLVRMTAHATKRPSQLSGGEQQRVALARALILNPDLLCLDEPLAALDQELRGAVLAEIQQLHRQRLTTTLYVTHNVAEAFSVGDSVGVMRDGTLVQVGSPRQVYDHPNSEFVARATGDVNVLAVEEANQRAESPTCKLRGGLIVHIPKGTMNIGSQIGIRPERLKPRETECDGPGFKATLAGVNFLGADVRLEYRTGNAGLVLSVLVHGNSLVGRNAAVGSEAFLCYAPEDWLFFP